MADRPETQERLSRYLRGSTDREEKAKEADENPASPDELAGTVRSDVEQIQYPFLVLAVNYSGTMRWVISMTPEIPQGFVKDGEIGILLQPLLMYALHNHGGDFRR